MGSTEATKHILNTNCKMLLRVHGIYDIICTDVAQCEEDHLQHVEDKQDTIVGKICSKLCCVREKPQIKGMRTIRGSS